MKKKARHKTGVVLRVRPDDSLQWRQLIHMRLMYWSKWCLRGAMEGRLNEWKSGDPVQCPMNDVFMLLKNTLHPEPKCVAVLRGLTFGGIIPWIFFNV